MTTLHQSEAPPPPSKPSHVAPAGTTDCHFHIFGPRDRYPLSPKRMYDPADAPLDSYLAMARTVGIERMVIVQASPYGMDNSCLLDSVEAFGLDRARGVAVVEPDVSDATLKDMDRKGVRGIRFNAITGGTPLEYLPELARRLAPLGWHIQLWIMGARLMEIADLVRDLPVPIVIDHMGQTPTSLGIEHKQFQSLLRLLERDHCWIKLCGYRVSTEGPPYADLKAPVDAILRTAPDRCVWGTDWPHPSLEGRPMPDAGRLFDLLYSWGSTEQVRKVLVDNPAKLYGFA